MPVRRIGRAGVGAGILDDAIARAAREIDLVHIRVPALVAGVNEAARIWADARRDGDAVVMRELNDVRAVYIRGVDFLLARLGRDEGDLRRCDAVPTGDERGD